MKNPHRMAWLLIYPQDDVERLKAGLSMGITRLIEFVSKPVTEDTAGAFLKALEIMFNRVHGPVVQKIEAKHAHLNMNKPIVQQDDPNRRLDELKTKIVQAREVTPVSEE
jgi:hypothetical protein